MSGKWTEMSEGVACVLGAQATGYCLLVGLATGGRTTRLVEWGWKLSGERTAERC